MMVMITKAFSVLLPMVVLQVWLTTVFDQHHRLAHCTAQMIAQAATTAKNANKMQLIIRLTESIITIVVLMTIGEMLMVMI